MKTKQIIILTIAATALFCIAGCGKQPFNKQRYWLDLQRPDSVSSKTPAGILSVEPFSIDSAFRTRSIVYKKTDHEFKNDFYMEYLIPPAKMFTEQTRQWLSDTGLFARVLPPGSIMKPTHVLEGHITKAYVDTSVNDQTTAELEISFYMLNREKGKKEILLGKTYTASEPMPSAKPEDYFKALKIALTKILQQYENDLAVQLNSFSARGDRFKKGG